LWRWQWERLRTHVAASEPAIVEPAFVERVAHDALRLHAGRSDVTVASADTRPVARQAPRRHPERLVACGSASPPGTQGSQCRKAGSGLTSRATCV
jgi:hypothetical protein